MGENRHQLRYAVQVGERAIDVQVMGDIDLANVDEFRTLLWEQPARPATLRLDLSGVEFLSAAAIRALVAVHLRTRARGGQLVLSNPQPTVRRVLRATRINRVIPIIGSSVLAADQAVRRPWPKTVPLPRLVRCTDHAPS